MSEPVGDRVTNKQLYDELNGLRRELPGRREIYTVITSALVLGQIAARLDIGSVKLPAVPMPQPETLELLTRLANALPHAF